MPPVLSQQESCPGGWPSGREALGRPTPGLGGGPARPRHPTRGRVPCTGPPQGPRGAACSPAGPWPRDPPGGARSLLEYDTETREVKVLLDQLRFPNGVQLSPAEDFVLVAETTMARIRRCVRGWPCRQQASASGRALGHVRWGMCVGGTAAGGAALPSVLCAGVRLRARFPPAVPRAAEGLAGEPASRARPQLFPCVYWDQGQFGGWLNFSLNGGPPLTACLVNFADSMCLA